MVLHRTFDPLDAAVSKCFQALGADPTYVRMCRNQRCFRARVSPKPWRIGIESHTEAASRRVARPPRPPPAAPEMGRRISEGRGRFRVVPLYGNFGTAPIHAAAAAVQSLHGTT